MGIIGILMLKCAVDPLLCQVMNKWTAQILWTLLKHGEHRFCYLHKQLGYVSSKVLTMR